jgi:hypothetical protein
MGRIRGNSFSINDVNDNDARDGGIDDWVTSNAFVGNSPHIIKIAHHITIY